MNRAKTSIVMPVLLFGLAILVAAPTEAAKPFILKMPVDFTDTFDANGNFTGVAFEAGKHDDVLPAICAALA